MIISVISIKIIATAVSKKNGGAIITQSHLMLFMIIILIAIWSGKKTKKGTGCCLNENIVSHLYGTGHSFGGGGGKVAKKS